MSAYRENAYRESGEPLALAMKRRAEKAREQLLLKSWEEATKIYPSIISKIEEEVDRGKKRASLTFILFSVLGLTGMSVGDAVDMIDPYLLKQVAKRLRQDSFKVTVNGKYADVVWDDA